MSLTLKQIRDRCQDDGDCWIWQQSLNGAGYPQAGSRQAGPANGPSSVWKNTAEPALRVHVYVP